jgi:hypothetical protein
MIKKKKKVGNYSPLYKEALVINCRLLSLAMCSLGTGFCAATRGERPSRGRRTHWVKDFFTYFSKNLSIHKRP